MTWRRAPLYTRSHDLNRWIHERIAGRQADYCGGIAGSIARAARDLLGSVALALTFPRERSAHQQRADEVLVRLRVQIVLATELGMFSPRQRRYMMAELLAVGRMLGGWRRAARRKGESRLAAIPAAANPTTGVEAPAAPTA